MSLDVRTPTLIDTSVLLNFLAVDRVDLLSRHPALRFIVTDHVRGEITDRRPDKRPIRTTKMYRLQWGQHIARCRNRCQLPFDK